jgi:hypothetical protein
MGSSNYVRYHISSQPAPNIAPHPNRFRVEVRRRRLAALLLKELYHYRANLAVVTSRPCVYGTFSGPVGGFAARPAYCVGCLRCTVEYPDVVQIRPNPDRVRLGDSYFTPDKVDTVLQEAVTGQIPVRGAGYRGTFGGPGWDGMWTDMSEIVRPTRDGIHGREFISTAVELGERPAFLTFDPAGNPSGRLPRGLSLPIPFLFDVPAGAAESATLYRGLAEAAARLESLAIVPLRRVLELGLHGAAIAPLAAPAEIELLQHLPAPPRVVELDAWEESAFLATRRRFPETAVFVRLPLERDLMPLVRAGVRLLHVTADYHGRCSGSCVRDAIRVAHAALVKDGLREETVLIGSGGIITASDVPKAIICGLDAVALDTAVLVALQARFEGECVDRASAVIRMPDFEPAWAAQRLMNLVAAWRDQMLEILGAMGLREVQRLRGELGRAMFHEDLEREAFTGVAGFEG